MLTILKFNFVGLCILPEIEHSYVLKYHNFSLFYSALLLPWICQYKINVPNKQKALQFRNFL